MVKKSKGKHRLDKFYHLAKEQGYRSRAAFKLIQLNRKYNFLEKCRSLLDLCAAPGGWLQVAVKTMPMSSLIIGVDLAPIRPVKGAKALIGDITTQKTRQALKKEANGSLMDAVIHDGAPNVGGAWASEAYTQSALVLEALRLATEFLAPRGTFVTKIFRSQDYNALLYAFNQLFDKVDATKPAASRNTSAEIFVVCLGYKAPSKIDPRLLDPKHLFQDVKEVPRNMGPDALIKMKMKQKKFREGYEEGLSTTHKQTSAVAFITASNPVEMLGQFSKFLLEGPGADLAADVADAGEMAPAIARHALTTPEIRALCADLQVLGRSEFKQLLKWRLQIKKELEVKRAKDASDDEEPAAKDSGKAREGGEEAKEKLDPEEALLAEMAEVKARMEQRRRKEKKRKREAKNKARVRAAQLAMSEGVGEEPRVGKEQLFSLAAVKGRNTAATLGESAAPDERELEQLEADSEEEAAESSGSEGDDSDDDRRRYDAIMDEYLEESYQSYLKRQGVRAEAARQKRKRLGMDGELGSDEDGDAAKVPAAMPVPQESDSDDENGLLVELDERRVGRATSNAAVAAQWFAQDLFNDPALVEDEPDADDKAEEAQAAKPAAKRVRIGAGGGGAPAAAAAGADAEAESDDDDQILKPPAAAKADKSGGFEVVPQDASASEDSDDDGSDPEFDALDERGKAEVLALAKKMLRRKDKQEILDAAYNRYASHDDRLPQWFIEDEQRHRRPPALVSKEEMEEERLRLRAIDARPIKKVAEAKARKRKRVQVKLEAARHKAEGIAAQDDVPTAAKTREIEKLYAKARATGKGKKAKPTRADQYKKKRPLDRRMLSDKREVKGKAKKKAMKKAGKGKGPAGKGGAKAGRKAR
ncbi:hypothetical protein WJX72_009544 [[Myrmecia] bisecta]|uniref:Putative rRNA methyltransferase n=1 Tax=[Myrmecia] bisecta TaxID=41462 RepID=A0AAW1Q1R5_9CHLO